MGDAVLLAIVEVPYDRRVTCQAVGCGHSVYRRIHVVRDGERLLVLGSDCFSKLFGGGPAKTPSYGLAAGRKLTDEERLMLMENTAQLIERFRMEHEQEMAKRRAVTQSVGGKESARPRRKIGPSEDEIRLFEAQAKKDVRAKFQVDADLPGWRGLVLQRITELAAKGDS